MSTNHRKNTYANWQNVEQLKMFSKWFAVLSQFFDLPRRYKTEYIVFLYSFTYILNGLNTSSKKKLTLGIKRN